MSTPVDEIRRAVATDFDRIVALLNLCGLPASDLTPQSLDGFHVAILAGEIVGVAGLEQSGDAACCARSQFGRKCANPAWGAASSTLPLR
jgi:N-acetylglutamate synthase-like GNAT family acetyltransferase